MKKLMIAASAALCAAVGFCEGEAAIQSANIVGYQTQTLPRTKNMLGAQFVSVNGQPLNALDIKVTINDEAPGDSGFDMWWWDAKAENPGYVYATWHSPYYLDDGTEEGLEVEGAMWCTSEEWFALVPAGTENPDDPTQKSTIDHTKTFEPGEGFWLQPVDPGTPKVTIAGAVLNSESPEVNMTLPRTKNMLVNPFPTAINALDIKVTINDEAPGDSGFDMWWWDAKAENPGYVYATWHSPYYLDDGTEEGLEVEGAMWCTSEEWFALVPAGTENPDDPTQKSTIGHTKIFEPGEGFWLQPVDPGTAKVTFKNPLKK